MAREWLSPHPASHHGAAGFLGEPKKNIEMNSNIEIIEDNAGGLTIQNTASKAVANFGHNHKHAQSGGYRAWSAQELSEYLEA